MPISYEIDATHDLMVYRAAGAVTEKDAINLIDRVVAETNGAAMYKDVLFLLDPHASISEIDVHAIRQIKGRIEHWLTKYPRAPIKCAIVSAPPEELVGELWRATTDAYPRIAERTRTFRTETDALAWLRP